MKNIDECNPDIAPQESIVVAPTRIYYDENKKIIMFTPKEKNTLRRYFIDYYTNNIVKFRGK